MKTFVVALAVLAMGFYFLGAYAGDDSLESFYESFLNARISKCERNASWVRSSGENLRAYGEMAMDEASFYTNNRKHLVDQMVEQGVGKDPQKVEYFLIKSYADFRSNRSLAAQRQGF